MAPLTSRCENPEGIDELLVVRIGLQGPSVSQLTAIRRWASENRTRETTSRVRRQEILNLVGRSMSNHHRGDL
ncbi:hypothetical protein I550_2287 [Mycobacterium intracellulare 1956]|uniref:Uncharacterized protein n=2 Tax=Mycobacterium intracellulare TaxID=1767 RepID=X8CTG6_MYCIT|nr:hypothetical protein OCU_23280 [Mycobacterium intracellulare ATCC 13950]EUA27149.1 hypothetical protein I548_5256 [Mycobacterium intracellulare]EUA59141.1 hypothetical protein I550_2287 [Mycobacterium intracellulare 1956]